jgi:hypothetical protein
MDLSINPAVKAAKVKMFKLAENENIKGATRYYDIRRHDIESDLKNAEIQSKEEGRIEAKVKIAMRLIDDNYSPAIIVKVTGLPITQINSLINKN